MYKQFQSENLKGRDHSEDLGMDGRIHVRQHGDQSINCRVFIDSLLAPQGGLCSKELAP